MAYVLLWLIFIMSMASIQHMAFYSVSVPQRLVLTFGTGSTNTKYIFVPQAKQLTQNVNHYIEARETGDGGDYWPIVKHVTLRIPRCRVLSSGTVLVDLPGIRDSNAARDKIAKDVSDCNVKLFSRSVICLLREIPVRL